MPRATDRIPWKLRSNTPSIRSGEAWTLRTVAEILANPRYTGRQVWNRQRTVHNEAEPGNKRTSHGPVRRWNPRDQWVISTRITHPPLVSESTSSGRKRSVPSRPPMTGSNATTCSPDS